MGNLWLKIKIWSKIVLGAVLLIFALVFIVKNHGEAVTVWLWNPIPTTILQLLLFTVLFSVVSTMLLGTAFRTLRQVRELKDRNKHAKMEKDMADMKAKAERLQTKPDESKI